MRKFNLNRIQDVSGVSGTGAVAQGVQFDDGTCAVRWISEYAATAVWDSIENLMYVHGHDGATELVWLD